MSVDDTTRAETTLADQQIFRDVIGRFASGVTVITTAVNGAPVGTTASAVSSLSLDPPMVLVCLNKSSETQSAVLEAGAFCVNILAEAQQDIAYQFAKKGDKFADVACDEGLAGVPVLRGTLAHLECRVDETVTGGTHTVFLAPRRRRHRARGSPADVLPRPVRPAGERPRGRGLPHRPRVGADPAVPARPAIRARDWRETPSTTRPTWRTRS